MNKDRLVYNAHSNSQPIAKTHMKSISLVIIAMIVVTAIVGCTSTPNAVKVASDNHTELLNRLFEATSALENGLISELESDRRRFREINANIEARRAIDRQPITPDIMRKISNAQTDKELRKEFLKLRKEVNKVRRSILHPPEIAESADETSAAREATYRDIPALIKVAEQEYKSAINDTRVKFERLRKSLELMREAHREVNRFLSIETKLEKEDVDKITQIIDKIGEIEKGIKKGKKRKRKRK